MVFKVGDKVKFNVDNQCFATEFGFDSKGVYEVQNVFGTIQLKNDSGAYHAFNFDRLELAEPKKSKNQRITSLENKVAELKNAIAEQIQWNDKQKQFNDSVIKKLNEIYEEINPTNEVVEDKQEVQRQTVTCAVAKTQNQLRAEIIAKAKKFVDETVAYGRSSNRYKSEGNSTYRSNFYDVDFFVKGNKVTAVIYWLRGNVTRVEKPEHVGRAKCAPGDVFNEHIGKAIALGRALGLDVSEFEQAVQPTEFVVGQIIANICGKKAEETVRVENNQAYDKYGMFWPIESLTEWNECKIINDTNAIYEEENK